MALGGRFPGNTTGQTKPKIRSMCELQCTQTDNTKGYFFQIRYYAQVSVAATSEFALNVEWHLYNGTTLTNTIKDTTIAKDATVYAVTDWIDVGWKTDGQSIRYGGTAYYTSGGNKYESKLDGTYIVRNESYSIDYNANGGYNAPGTQTFVPGDSVQISNQIPLYNGRRFKCWNTSSDGKGINYMPGSIHTANESITLYAIWEVRTLTVTFKPNGGTGIESQVVYSYGKKDQYFTTNDFVKNGYYLAGWSESQNGSVKYATTMHVTDSWLDGRGTIAAMTLYAVWSSAGESSPIYISKNGTYKQGTAYVYKNGAYKKCQKAYVMKNGTYK